MEFSEAFRAEDISKTDFFDFVVAPEDMGNDIVLHNNFPWSRKSMGLFANNNNNADNVTDVANGSASNGGDGTELHPSKETNNNNVLPNFADDTFWGSTAKAAFAAAAAAVNVKMESPTLEDINDICWSSSSCIGTPESDDQNRNNQRDKDDTDGSIYTLTVVNGQDAPAPPPTWYRPPDLSSILREGDEHLRQAMSAVNPTGQYQTNLDIDSIISILPSLPSMAETLSEQGPIGHGLFNSTADSGADVMSNSLMVSSKQHAGCEDSGFVESKEDAPKSTSLGVANPVGNPVGSTGSGHQEQQRPPTEDGGYSENNNDWTFSNNESSAESLLRSALQGGKSFLSQYNSHQHMDNKTLTELQSGLPPPDSMGLFMGGGEGMLDNGSVLLFDDTGGGMYGGGPASSTTQQCMDEILLSPLDDYEKLKMIENEVAESAKRYGGGIDPHGQPNGVHSPYVPVTAVAHSSTPPKPKKKSNKKSSDRPAGSASKSKAPAAVSSLGSGIPTSNGARRERSLHHCTICSKAFKDKYSVNVHIRTHTGEKPFACSVCGKSFRQKAHLAKHYHTHIVQKTTEQLGPTKAIPTKAR